MKNLSIKILPWILAMFLFTSCEDFLKETSQDEFEPETTASFAELLQGQGYPFLSVKLDGLTMLMDDDIETFSYSYHAEAAIAAKSVYTWQPNMHAVLEEANLYQKMYEEHYSRIMICNMITELVGDSKGTQAEKNQLLGEALTLRAFYYWQLVNFFAKPYNDKQSSPEKNPGVVLSLKSEVLNEARSRNSVQEVYEQIVTDIEAAVNYLEMERNNNGVFRINHIGARLLASRIYLYMENWDKVIEHTTAALAYAPELADLPNYTLSNTNNPTNGPISSNFPETIFAFQGRSLPNGVSFFGPYSLSSELVSTFEAGDSRNGKYFYYVSWGGFHACNKAGISEMNYVWRTAELYLNRAEAYLMKYKAGENTAGPLAVNDLNTLRKNRISASMYADYQLTTSEALETFYQAERRRELFMEGYRWFDLRRQGMPRIEHVWVDTDGTQTRYVLEENDPGYVIPIPQAVLDRNTQLTQNELAPVRNGL